MKFDEIYTEKRLGSNKTSEGTRSGFQRDFDRLIFSSGFRRLQNKTQVFPLPGTAFVHNRLTHSLEVASVGRSLGKMAGDHISGMELQNPDSKDFYKYELANVIAAGCLAHDIGNPPFGHSGESAISAWFIENENNKIGDKSLREHFSNTEWADLINFEGNANSVRLLTHNFRGRYKGGYGLTYTTIASILKYPCEASAVDKKFIHRKKYSFFQSEKPIIAEIMEAMQMNKTDSSPLIYQRHPFVYLVEAADDICYNIIDIEDAHRLKILENNVVKELFLNLIRELDESVAGRVSGYINNYTDKNEGIAFLRARVISLLVGKCMEVFKEFTPQILDGAFNDTLMGVLKKNGTALNEIEKISIDKIYNNDTVVQLEVAGYNVISELLDLFAPALLTSSANDKEKKLLKLIPYQFTEFENSNSHYEKILNVLDYISGMTDEYATDLYRKLKGITIPRHG